MSKIIKPGRDAKIGDIWKYGDHLYLLLGVDGKNDKWVTWKAWNMTCNMLTRLALHESLPRSEFISRIDD